ncbi:MAG: hypothetical protein IJ001_04160 [Oscillospiraceae bacterium]|nr:hypothetical protein [Oscillospiraceae bacterium]
MSRCLFSISHGVGNVIGTFFGVLVNGKLVAPWSSIITAIALCLILLQAVFANKANFAQNTRRSFLHLFYTSGII